MSTDTGFTNFQKQSGFLAHPVLSSSGLATLTLKKIKSKRHTKFRTDISIHGRDITTSGFGNQTAAILKFFSGYDFDLLTVIGM